MIKKKKDVASKITSRICNRIPLKATSHFFCSSNLFMAEASYYRFRPSPLATQSKYHRHKKKHTYSDSTDCWEWTENFKTLPGGRVEREQKKKKNKLILVPQDFFFFDQRSFIKKAVSALL